MRNKIILAVYLVIVSVVLVAKGCKSAPPADPCRHEKQNMQIDVLQRALSASNDTIKMQNTIIELMVIDIDSMNRVDVSICPIKVTRPYADCEYWLYFGDSIKPEAYFYNIESGIVKISCVKFD